MERAAARSKPCLCDCACNRRPRASKNSFIVRGAGRARFEPLGQTHAQVGPARHGHNGLLLRACEACVRPCPRLARLSLHCVWYYCAIVLIYYCIIILYFIILLLWWMTCRAREQKT